MNKVIVTVITCYWLTLGSIQYFKVIYKSNPSCTENTMLSVQRAVILMRCREIMVVCCINRLIPIGSVEKMRTFVCYIRGTYVSSLCFKRLMRAVIFVAGNVGKLSFPSLFLQSHHTYCMSILVFAWQLCNTSFHELCG